MRAELSQMTKPKPPQSKVIILKHCLNYKYKEQMKSDIQITKQKSKLKYSLIAIVLWLAK